MLRPSQVTNGTTIQAITDPTPGLLPDPSFTQLVNDALRNYQSTLALSRSPLANSSLVAPTLVKDESSPTAEERGHGLRLLLQWAVNQLAPTTPAYPQGKHRPFDDPTWRDPRWWRYNILRHRYLEPLHPDDFVAGGRHTETLLALTGISSTDAFFDERNRAIRDVAGRLQQQRNDGQANDELARMALCEAMAPLERQAEATTLLGIAATFDDIFPRTLLLDIAGQELVRQPTAMLDALIAQHFLRTGDEGASLWLSPVLRSYIYVRVPAAVLARRHRWIAAHYAARGAILPAARHWQRAGQPAQAVRVLLPAVDELVCELQIRDLIDLFQQIAEEGLDEGQWYTIQVLLCDLYQRSGRHEDALAAGRRALQASADPTKQARIYRRMGKLYESRNQLHALRYYQQAVERFHANDAELAMLLKDRGWLYFYRQEWQKAEHDLQRALHCLAADDHLLRADIYDLMGNLYRKTGDHGRALAYAERALAIREEHGDLLRVAKSHANLGLLYRSMGEYSHAIAAYHEAMNVYEKVGNQEVTATMLLNIGAAHYLDNRKDEAICAYRESLATCQVIGLPLIELKAHYNLAEVFSDMNQHEQAACHWQAGIALCRQHGFDDQEADFVALRTNIQASLDVIRRSSQRIDPFAVTPLDEDEAAILTLARREHVLTPKRLMHAAHISRATATRRLTSLVEKGYLSVEGKGRGTVYRPTATTSPTLPQPSLTERFRDLLQPHRDEFRQRFHVTALGVVATSGLDVGRVKLAVRFTTTPGLPCFFMLQSCLADRLQAEVDLWPAGVVDPPTGANTPDNVLWLWQ